MSVEQEPTPFDKFNGQLEELSEELSGFAANLDHTLQRRKEILERFMDHIISVGDVTQKVTRLSHAESDFVTRTNGHLDRIAEEIQGLKQLTQSSPLESEQ